MDMDFGIDFYLSFRSLTYPRSSTEQHALEMAFWTKIDGGNWLACSLCISFEL